jgi:hypothetical protein
MEQSTTDVSSHIHTTTFLVPDLCCPSYNSVIEETLYALRPKPISVSPSIVSQWVIVRHDPSLSVSTMTEALKKVGFENCDVVQDS